MEAPDFWDDAEVSQKKMKELKDMKDDMETYQNLVTQMEDMETMIEMGYEENDPEIVPETVSYTHLTLPTTERV